MRQDIESTKLQYALRGRAIALGWRDEQIIVIDNDQGESGRAIAESWLRRGRSGGGCYGLTVGRLGDDLDSVVECHTKNEFWQLVVAIETAPAFLCALDQFEDHSERGPIQSRRAHDVARFTRSSKAIDNATGSASHRTHKTPYGQDCARIRLMLTNVTFSTIEHSLTTIDL